MSDEEFRTDPARRGCVTETGIFVRAKVGDKWDIVDIAELDKASLLAWLRSRGGDNQWAENCVGMLLGHGAIRP
jgi:hypothetical protein